VGFVFYEIEEQPLRSIKSKNHHSGYLDYITYHFCSYIIWVVSIFGFSYDAVAQEYQITNVPVYNYSIDRFTNEIYYQHDFTGEIYKTNSTGSYHILTNFSSLPQFSNNSHTAAYIYTHNQSDKDLYLHDFEKDTSYLLVNSPYLGSNLLFSPSDIKILVSLPPFNDDKLSEGNLKYYSFEDSSLHDPGITIYTEDLYWLTDTTMLSRQAIYEIHSININDLIVDTLVRASDLESIRGLDYNKNLNAFAYGWKYNQAENTLINIYYLSNGFDTTVYNFLEDGPSLGGFTIIARSLKWETNTNKLWFIGEVSLVELSQILVFDYNLFETQLYSDPYTTGNGIKYNLQWLNSDTVLYLDASDAWVLFGLDVTDPVSVFENSPEAINELYVKVYPNPFNNTSKILIDIPSQGDLTIEVYNCLGEIIEKKSFDFVRECNLTLDWNEINSKKNIASGIYFIRTSLVGRKYSSHKTAKVIYLK
jgi:hypothetical protein